MESKMKDKLAVVGAIVLFIGLILQFVKLAWAPYVYLVGACLFAYVQLVSDYKGKNIIIRRLRRQQLLGAMLLVLTGVINGMNGLCALRWPRYWNFTRHSAFRRKKQKRINVTV